MNISAAALAAALGPTPQGTPTSTATFRATRTTLQQVAQQLAPQQQPAPQPVRPATIRGLPNPRAGGVSSTGAFHTAWVGEGTTAATRLVQPASAKAFRSTDLSIQMKTEKACIAGLVESRRLPSPGSMDSKDMQSVISLTDWIRALSIALKECGMDSVFRATLLNGNEVYLIEKWGQATAAMIETHLNDLRALNDPYDTVNLSMSAKFILNSLTDDMLKRVEQELGQTSNADITGPDVFRAVIGLHSVLNDSTERQYIEKLQLLKLTDEPGEDVSTFSNKVVALAHHINGLTEHGVADLHVLVYTAFDGASTPTFATAVSHLLSQCFLGAGTPANQLYDWERQVGALLIMYRDIKSRNLWVALRNHKEVVESQGLVSTTKQVEMLTAEVRRLTRIAGNTSTTNTTTAQPIICRTCGAPGHKSPQCPNNVGNPYLKTREGPKDNEPHTKTHDGSEYKWCGVCRRWNTGTKAHLTAEHVRRPAASGQLAQSTAGPMVSSDPSPDSAGEIEVVGTLSSVRGFLSTAPTRAIVPLKPVLTRDTHFITGTTQYARWTIEDKDACPVNALGSRYCSTCRQHSTDPDHCYTTVHAYNLYIKQEWEHNRVLADQQGVYSPHVVGFVGSIGDISIDSIDESAFGSVPSTEEEDIVQDEAAIDLAKWLLTRGDGSLHCRVCNVPVTDAAIHENTNDHFQTRLLSDMKDHFAARRLPDLHRSVRTTYVPSHLSTSNPFAALMDDDDDIQDRLIVVKTEEAAAKTEEAVAKTEEAVAKTEEAVASSDVVVCYNPNPSYRSNPNHRPDALATTSDAYNPKPVYHTKQSSHRTKKTKKHLNYHTGHR